MSTKDSCFLKEEQQNFGGFSTSKNGTLQYDNLNLNNQNHGKASETFEAGFKQSKNISSDFYKNEKQNYVSNKKSDLTKLSQIQSKSHLSLKQFDGDKKVEIQKQWKKDGKNYSNSTKSNNNSTLSLHISAYENFIIASQKDDSKKQNSDQKAWKNHMNLTSAIQNPFEYPRQQENSKNDPEIMQFKASQQLFNPNEAKHRKIHGLCGVKTPMIESSRIMEGVGGVSLKEDLVDLSNSLDAILTQTIAAFVNCAKKRTVDDDLAHLTSLFSNKSDCFKKMVRQVNFRHGKEDYIKKLDKSVAERSEVLAEQTEKLTDAFKLVSNAHFNGQKSLRKAKAQSKSFEPEEVLRFSHLISKNFSVASPHFWQQGDPMRPYPTELHFRISAFGNAVDGIKDPKELGIMPSSSNLPSTSMYNENTTTAGEDMNEQTINLNNQEITSTSYLPSNSTMDDQRRVELILPSSSSTNAGQSTSHPQATYTSGLMSSDEDSDDD